MGKNDDRKVKIDGEFYIIPDGLTVEDVLAMIHAADQDEADSHSCRANMNAEGICKICGYIVSGTVADYEAHGYDLSEVGE